MAEEVSSGKMEEGGSKAASARDWEPSLRVDQIVYAIRIHSKLMLACLLAAILLSIGIYIFATPTYEAEVALIPKPDSELQQGQLSGGSGLQSLLAIGLGENAAGNVNQYLAILKSRSLLVPFLETRGLVPVLADESINGKDALQLKAYDLFLKKHLSVEYDQLSEVILLRVKWSDPVLAAQWANELVGLLNNRLQQEYVDSTNKKVDYLEQTLKKQQVTERRALVVDLIEQEQRKLLVAVGQEEFAFQIIDPAVAPSEAVFPKIAVLLVVGILGGGGLGLVIALILQRR